MVLEDVAIKLQETTDRSIRNEGRIKKLESEHEALHKLATSVAVMAEQMKTMNISVAALTEEVEELKERPAKRWEALVGVIVSGLVGIAIGFIAVKLGL